MAFNGAGLFVRLYNWVTDAAGSVKIQAARMDAEMDGMATALSTCVTKDGQQTITANLPMSGFKFTGLGNGSSLQDSATLKDVQNDQTHWSGTSSGAANTYTFNTTPVIAAYVTGQTFAFVSHQANTGAAQINVCALGLKSITKNGATALASGDIPNGALIEVRYDGTQFQLVGSVAGALTLPLVIGSGGTGQTTANAAFNALAAAGGTLAGGLYSMSSRAFNEAKGAAVASANSCDIWTPADGNLLHITGVTTITSFATAPQTGVERAVIFDGILTLTNNANIVLPGGANITTAAGDIFIFRADTTAKVVVVGYALASGKAIVGSAATSVVSVKQQNFTASGTYTPSTGMLFCMVEMVGGGGGGGNGSAASNGSGGGGAGQYSRALLTAAQIGASKAITIPAAAGGGNGGGTVTLTTLCTAVGGSVGGTGNANFVAGGLGGSGGTSDIATTGAPGGWGGGTTQFPAGVIGGSGGSSPFGGGGNTTGGVGGGTAATGFGSGGGGSGGNNTGGAGTKGVVYITEYCSQ